MGTHSQKSSEASKKNKAASGNDSPKAVEAAQRATKEIANQIQKSGRRIPDRH